jgi:ketosteroid isomerase-like protein
MSSALEAFPSRHRVPANDRESIEQRRADYVAAFNRGDVAAMAEYATADTIGMAPNRPSIRGLDAHRQLWSEGFAAAKSLFYVYPEELEIAGDIAVDQHRWVLDSMPKRGGRPIHDEGKGIWIWRRQGDGAWKVSRGIWNSDLPRADVRPGQGSKVSDDYNEINRLLALFIETINAGDAKAWGELMTEDIIFSVPAAPRFIGKETAVAAAQAGFFDPFTLQIASKFEDVQLFGLQGFAHGVFTLEMNPKSGGQTIVLPGKFTNLFRKQTDGSWRFALVIFSYDQPMA